MNAPRMPSLASALPVALAVLFLVRLLGCLDADPLGPGAGGASLAVHITAVRDGSLGKTDVPDTLRVVLHDVTGFPHTDAPESFPVAAEATAYTEREDATGRHLLSRLEVELLEERVFRVVVRFSFGENSTREAIAGQRTIALRPGDRKSIQMVMADAKRPASGEYGLSIARSTASPGARHGIPIVLRNGSPIGGLKSSKFDSTRARSTPCSGSRSIRRAVFTRAQRGIRSSARATRSRPTRRFGFSPSISARSMGTRSAARFVRSPRGTIFSSSFSSA